jgi:hypothetical protein
MRLHRALQRASFHPRKHDPGQRFPPAGSSVMRADRLGAADGQHLAPPASVITLAMEESDPAARSPSTSSWQILIAFAVGSF